MQAIYVHFPFCERKCAYCDFVSFKCDDNVKEKYVERIIEEIKHKREKYTETVSSIYFGGGTPTCVNAKLLCNVLDSIKANFEICENAEITIEGNPATFDEDKLIELKECGFNRFSVGVQSFNDAELKSVERIHSGADAENACKLLAKVFENYSLDLMLGLPNQTIKSLENSIERAIALEPKHISCYMLKVEKNTPLEKLVKNKQVVIPDDDTVADFYDFAVKKFEARGYMQYETSNFAKCGYHSRHNMAYWEMQNYLGIGISSHSLVERKRFYNDENLSEYIKCGETELLEETLSDEDFEKEYIMLALRLNRGINLEDYIEKFNENFTVKYSSAIDKTKNYIDITDNSISIKQKYFSVASSVIIEFM